MEASSEGKLRRMIGLLTEAQINMKTHQALLAVHDDAKGSPVLEIIVRHADGTCSPPLRPGLEPCGVAATANEDMERARIQALLAPLINSYAGKYHRTLSEARELMNDLNAWKTPMLAGAKAAEAAGDYRKAEVDPT